MEAAHYSVTELERMHERKLAASSIRSHLSHCEQCSYLLALVRRAQGDPSDEEREVTVDLLKRWSDRPAPGARVGEGRKSSHSDTVDSAG